MKVRDLSGEQFKDVELKKVSLADRLALIRRKDASLLHQLQIMANREYALISKLLDKNIAFNTDDPRSTGDRFYIGQIKYNSHYIEDVPANEPIKRAVMKMWAREKELKEMRRALSRSKKGVLAADSRKQKQRQGVPE